ncbi:MAG: hypothetical protein ACKVVP_01685 [Chloroflexota bacterium]
MWQITKEAGDSTTFGPYTVTPEVRMFVWRGAHGGIVWSVPSAVLVERAGQTERVAITDVTRVLQLLLLGIVIALPLMDLWGGIRVRRSTNDQ